VAVPLLLLLFAILQVGLVFFANFTLENAAAQGARLIRTRAVNSAYAVPAGLTEAGSSVIVAEITYDFTPLVGLSSFFSPGSFQLKRTFYARPRRTLAVARSN
jgi:TadE-like protein